MCAHIISQKKKKIVEWICGNSIAKIRRKKKLLQLVYGNAITEIGGEIFFFFKKLYVHTIFTIFLQQILSGMLLLLD